MPSDLMSDTDELMILVEDGVAAQPVSAASLPLPTGAATLAEQQTQTASLGVMDDWDESDRAKVNLIVGQAGIAGGTGVDGVTVPRVTLATNVPLPAGTNNIGDVDVLTINGVAPAFGTGVRGATVQRVTIATDDLVPVSVASLPLPTGAATLAEQQTQTASLSVLDDWDESDRAKVNLIVGQAGIAAGTGVDGVTVPRVTLATNVGLPAGTNNIGDVDIASIAAGDNNIGNVDVLTVPADPFGVNADAASATGSISAKLRGIATALGITALDLGSGTGGTRTLRTFQDTAQFVGGTGASTSATQRMTLATDIALPAGNNNIGDVDVASVVPGTGATNLGKAEDSPHTTADVGVMVLGVRRDTPTALGADNDYIPPTMDANGATWVSLATKLDATNDTVGIGPQTTGGLTTFHLASAGSTNATSVKASAGQLYGWYIYNSNAAARKVAFHNTAGTPTAGASVFFSLVIPPSSGANVLGAIGIPFSTGIGITTVTGLADSDSAAVAANDLIINLFYK